MSILNNLKTFTKIAGLSVALLVFIGVLGGIGYYYTNQATEDMSELYNDRLLPVYWLNEGLTMVRAIDANLFEMMLATNPSRRTELEADNTRRSGILNTHLENYGKTKLDPYEQEKLAELKTNLQAARA